jgi:hypothetical protein
MRVRSVDNCGRSRLREAHRPARQVVAEVRGHGTPRCEAAAGGCVQRTWRCHISWIAGVLMSTPPMRRTDEHHPNPQGRDHRPLRRAGEEVQPEAARPRAGAAGRVLAQPRRTQGHHGHRRQGPEVGRLRPQPEVLRPPGRLGADRVQLVPGLRLLPGVQRAPRHGQGPRVAALARLGRVHAAAARRDGLRRGDDPDPAGRDGRDGRRAARAARGGGPGRAHGVHRAGQHECPGQCGPDLRSPA